MKKLLTIALTSLLINSVFADEVKETPISKGISDLLSYEQPNLNFLKPHEFKISDAKTLIVSYDKYALKDLGVNEKQFLLHIDEFTKHALEYLEDKDVSGPMLISFSLKAVQPKDKTIVCAETPKKCSLNSVEIILDPQYKNINQTIAPYIIKQLDRESQNIKDISKDYSEPIINNFEYIGDMRAFILINLTAPNKITAKEEKLIKAIKKTIPNLIYPEGEESAKNFSELQQKYWLIDKNNSKNNINENENQNKIEQSDMINPSNPDDLNTNKEVPLTDEQKTLMEFNQQRQKLFPLPQPKRFNSQNNNEA